MISYPLTFEGQHPQPLIEMNSGFETYHPNVESSVPTTGADFAGSGFDNCIKTEGEQRHRENAKGTAMKHQCTVCFKWFKFASKLERHYLIHTGQKPFTCLVCGRAFRQSIHLKKHQETHKKWSPFKDSFQQLDFTDGGEFIESTPHERIQEDSHCGIANDSPLPACTVSQEDEQNQSEHPNVNALNTKVTEPVQWISTDGLHDPEGLVLDRQTAAKQILQEHQFNSFTEEKVISQRKKVHQCTVCLKFFNSPYKLQRHFLIHTGQKPFECSTCGKKFRQMVHLKLHSQTHIKLNSPLHPFPNDLIGLNYANQLQDEYCTRNETDCNTTAERAFGQSETHEIAKNGTGESLASPKGKRKKGHQCTVCQKVFNSPSKLQRHYLIHTDLRPFDCWECGKTFRQLAHLKVHQETHRNRREFGNSSQEEMVSGSEHYETQDESHGKREFSSWEISFDVSAQLNSLQGHKPVASHPLSGADCSVNIPPDQQSNNFIPNKAENPTVPSREPKTTMGLQMDHFPLLQEKATHRIGSCRNQCSVCFKSFKFASKLERHYLIHTGVRPFKCLVCGVMFRQAAHLKKHQVKHTKSQDFNYACHRDNSLPENQQPLPGDSVHELAPGSPLQPFEENELQQAEHLELNIIVKPEDPSENWQINSDVDIEVATTSETFQHQQPKNKEPKMTRKPHQCVMCLKYFTSPYKLQRHFLTHTGQRPFDCKVCGKTFRQLEHLKFHKRTHFHLDVLHQGEKTIEISSSAPDQIVCEKLPALSELNTDVFIQQNTLKELGESDPPDVKTEDAQESFFNCAESQTSFSTEEVPKDPVLGCDQIKKNRTHQCLLCLKCFDCPSKLQRHYLTHTGQKPFRCFACGKEFRQAIHLKVHQRTHNKWRTFKSAFQQQKFLNSNQFSREMNPGYEKSQGSLENFSQSDFQPDFGLPESKESDAYTANDVSKDKMFQEKYGITVDNLGDADISRRVYQCSKCLKCFSAPSQLERHYLIHTGQKPFECHICRRAFRQSSHLKAHYRTHKDMKTLKGGFQHRRFISFRKLADQKQNHARKKFCLLQGASNTESLPYTLKDMKGHHIGTAASVVERDQMPEQKKNLTQDQTIQEQSNSSNAEGKNVKRRVHQCCLCQKSFDCPSKLQRHYLSHTGQKPFECYVCGRKFRQLTHLKRHQQSHMALKSSTQPRRLWNADRSQSHAVNRTDHSPTGGLIPHILSQASILQDQNLKQCKFTVAVQSGNLRQKRAIVGVSETQENTEGCFSVEQPILCTESHSAENRENVQSSKRVYQCSNCFKCFDAPSQLERHYLIHTGQRPFECYVCSKAFRQLSHLKTHQRTHKEWRPLKYPFQSDESKETKQNQIKQGSSVIYNVSSFDLDSRTFVLQEQKVNRTEPVAEVVPPVPTHDLPNNSTICQYGSYEACVLGGQAPIAPQSCLYQAGEKRTGKRPVYQCSVCPKNFTSPSKLKRHFLIHTGLKPFKCYVCNKSFRQHCHLQNHQHTHAALKYRAIRRPSENRPPERTALERCSPVASALPKQTPRDSTAQSDCPPGVNVNHCSTINDNCEHSREDSDIESNGIQERNRTDSADKFEGRVRLGKKKHTCSECLKCFSSPSKLERHYLIHAGEKPFECAVCNKTFRQAAHLKVHQRVHAKQVHGTEYLQKESSISDFSEDRSLHIHQSCQLEANSDPTPQSIVATEEGLGDQLPKTDLTSDPNGYWCEPISDGLFRCAECDGYFVTERKLQVHKCVLKNQTQIRNPSRSLYQCAICFKSFDSPSKLKRHYVIHTGQRPFQCSVCRKTFTQSCHLKTHQLTHFK
ncbi:zinc finger protein 729 [Amia ocellicauda]|uniref:zinc finger protein 729 n=1 Tax=Amia ocellicauda TaxID=2972642 RepID=UPI0034643BAA